MYTYISIYTYIHTYIHTEVRFQCVSRPQSREREEQHDAQGPHVCMYGVYEWGLGYEEHLRGLVALLANIHMRDALVRVRGVGWHSLRQASTLDCHPEIDDDELEGIACVRHHFHDHVFKGHVPVTDAVVPQQFQPVQELGHHVSGCGGVHSTSLRDLGEQVTETVERHDGIDVANVIIGDAAVDLVSDIRYDVYVDVGRQRH